MKKDIAELLCNQSIDIALIVKEAERVIDESRFLTTFPEKFLERMWKIQGQVYNLFINYHYNNNLNDDNVNDEMIDLMYTIVEYKHLYRNKSYGYKVMNSLLDVVIETFNEINE